MDIHNVHNEAENVILEIAEIFFFLFVAMTYIESLIHMGVFDTLKYILFRKVIAIENFLVNWIYSIFLISNSR